MNKNVEIPFYGRQIFFSAKDCEAMFWLVEESGMDDEQKIRLTNKLRGWFVSPETEERSRKLLAKRSRRMR